VAAKKSGGKRKAATGTGSAKKAGAKALVADADMVQLLAPSGELVKGAKPLLDAQGALRAHELMLLLRALDDRMVKLQRQGRVGFYGTCTGEESSVIGVAAGLNDDDWILPALRQGAIMLWRGFDLVPYIAQVFGNSGDETKARQMPSHQASLSVRQVSWGSCIANQLTQALGVAKACQLAGKGEVAVGFIGDGGTSEGDFHVALNMAAVLKVPAVFVCQNNQWAISVPLERQTRVTRLADKAQAYGMPGVRVDGNDLFAVQRVVKEAADRARAGEGPTFIECLTYRVGAHSTSDDPSRYRDESITERWRSERDPVLRLETWLAAEGLRNAADVERLQQDAFEKVDAAVKTVESLPGVERQSLIEDVYRETPDELRRQWAAWNGFAPLQPPHA
jgi:pyruvate dehydrogenase E1 component alpha subunit/2-oxoisovalerate dehydrogenase E1 component alpha subunit